MERYFPRPYSPVLGPTQPPTVDMGSLSRRQSSLDVTLTTHPHLALRLKKDSYTKSLQDTIYLNLILENNSTCFGQTYYPSLGVLILYSQQLVFVILVMLHVC